MTPTRLLAGSAAMLLVFGLAACAPESERPGVIDTGVPSPEPTAVETTQPEPEPETFAMPDDCTVILPPARVEDFLAQGIELVGGPGTEIGATYLPEPTGEESAGGISCFFEDIARPNIAVFTISVAPLVPSVRTEVITDLTAQGLNEGQTASGDVTYWVIGDEKGRSAVYNIITNEAWISVVTAYGGQVFYDEAVIVADDVVDIVYN